MPVERLSPGDLMQLASDVGPVAMNIGAVLRLDVEGMETDQVRLALIDRVSGIRRLSQRLQRVPLGLGRPIWIDDPAFDAAAHVSHVRCPAPGDAAALMSLATHVVTTPLPRDRPLWRAVLVTGLAGGDGALIIALHHVVADGIGGLAVLAGLDDAARPVPAAGLKTGAPVGRACRDQGAGVVPVQAADRRVLPTRRELLADRTSEWLRNVRTAPSAIAAIRHARGELGVVPSAPRSTLNVPTGNRRHVEVVEVELAAVHAAARRHAATVNDVLLVAATAALETVLADRGEHAPHLVVSVPVSGRISAKASELGNRVGVMPVAVPLEGSLSERLTRVAAVTAHQRSGVRASSAALLGPAFRVLAVAGVLHWFVDRQRLVNTFLTNLRGPTEPLALGGAVIRSITPITTIAGNVTVSFAALSYAGGLTVSVITDPQRVPEHEHVARALIRHVHELMA